MNTTRKNTLGWSIALIVAAGFASAALGGPGPQYWQQMDQARAERATKAAVAAPAKNPAQGSAMACANCKNSKVEEFSATNVSGKLAPHTTTIGVKHDCVSCGGAVTTVRGKVTNDMKGNCPSCAKPEAGQTGCCF